MTLFDQYKNSSLDSAAIGLDIQPEASPLVCTPLGAAVIGWAAPQGLHFCFVPGFGETVFAVDPHAQPEHCIAPVAADFRDFLGLILRCRGAYHIAKAATCSKTHFHTEVNSTFLSLKQQRILRAIENTFHPGMIIEPYEYIRNLQEEFDYSSLPLHPDYGRQYPVRPGPVKWEVSFGSGFNAPSSGKPGKLIPVGKTFQRGSETWHFPALYDCAKGIVIDCFVQLDEAAVRRYQEKWSAVTQPDWEQEMLMQSEDPLALQTDLLFTLDGKAIRNLSTCREYWLPWQENEPSLLRTLTHYGLDPEQPWVLLRISAERRGKGKKKDLRSLKLMLEAHYITIPGMQFTDPIPGAKYQFHHAGLGSNHVLTVMSCTREELDPNFLWNVPSHYRLLTYRIEPETDDIWLRIRDRAENDPFASGCAPVEILGTAGNSAALFLTRPEVAGVHISVSALHYQSAASVTWQMLLRVKKQPDMSWQLL